MSIEHECLDVNEILQRLSIENITDAHLLDGRLVPHPKVGKYYYHCGSCGLCSAHIQVGAKKSTFIQPSCTCFLAYPISCCFIIFYIVIYCNILHEHVKIL